MSSEETSEVIDSLIRQGRSFAIYREKKTRDSSCRVPVLPAFYTA